MRHTTHAESATAAAHGRFRETHVANVHETPNAFIAAVPMESLPPTHYVYLQINQYRVWPIELELELLCILDKVLGQLENYYETTCYL